MSPHRDSEQILADAERLSALWLKQATTQLSATEIQELTGLLAQIEPTVQALTEFSTEVRGAVRATYNRAGAPLGDSDQAAWWWMQQLHAALAEERDTLSIVDVGSISPAKSPETPVPVVVIDPAGRPELLDIGRIINQEQPGAMKVRWWATLMPPAAEVVLMIDLVAPVAFSLRLGFHLPRETDLLESIIEAPAFAITPYPLQGAERTVEPSSVIVVTCPDEYGVARAALDQVDLWNGG